MPIRPNRAKEKLQRGEVVTTISGLQDSDIIDFLGPLGFDAAWIECEHGPVDWDALGDMTRACDLWGMTSVTRVNANDPGLITRTLDRGSMGIVVPHVNSRESAEQAALSAKYAPIGYRGMFGGRQSFGVSDYFHTANDQTMVIVLLEEVEALENIEEILKVDNIDVFFVAPSDLAQTMGHIGNAEHPEVQSAIETAIGKIVDAGRTPGTLANDANMEKFKGNGRQVHDDFVERLGRQGSSGVPAEGQGLSRNQKGMLSPLPEEGGSGEAVHKERPCTAVARWQGQPQGLPLPPISVAGSRHWHTVIVRLSLGALAGSMPVDQNQLSVGGTALGSAGFLLWSRLHPGGIDRQNGDGSGDKQGGTHADECPVPQVL